MCAHGKVRISPGSALRSSASTKCLQPTRPLWPCCRIGCSGRSERRSRLTDRAARRESFRGSGNAKSVLRQMPGWQFPLLAVDCHAWPPPMRESAGDRAHCMEWASPLAEPGNEAWGTQSRSPASRTLRVAGNVHDPSPYSLGAQPNARRNCRLKCEMSLKPQAYAIEEMRTSLPPLLRASRSWQADSSRFCSK